MHISIPKPCHEDWNEMTPARQGAFCKVCSKTVIDFSQMSDEEIISYLENKDKEKTCGRFYSSQLSPYELKVDLREIPVRRSFSKLFAVTLFLIFSGLFICKSDTGNIISLKINSFIPADTSVLALNIDTTANPPDLATAASETVKQSPAVMGGISFPQDLIKKPDTIIIKPDTVLKANKPLLMGKVACSNALKPVENNNKLPVATNNRKMMKGQIIVGDIAF